MTQEQFDRLPKFAQERIRTLERERSTAIDQLNEFVDGQTESWVWIDEAVCTGEHKGPSFKRHYIQTRSVTFLIGKTEVRVGIDLHDPAQLNINCGGNQMIFQPLASNAIRILDK